MRVTKNVASYIEREVNRRLREGQYASQLADAKAADTMHEDVLSFLKDTLNVKLKEEVKKWADQYDFFEMNEDLSTEIIGSYTLSHVITVAEPHRAATLEKKISAKARTMAEEIIVELELGATKEWLAQKLAEI